MRTFLVKTFGCQMNKHDSERIAGLLLRDGLARASSLEEADVVVFNTCCVRKHAEDRLYSNVGQLASLKRKKTNLIIAVGGCIGQNEGPEILKKFPHVNVAFGTHNYFNLPLLLRKSEETGSQVCETLKSSQTEMGEFPCERESSFKAWVPVTIGCDNFCSYCVVPYVRGREKSRKIEEIKKEIDSLAQDGVLEVTLLGQNVNSYGRDLYGESRFAELLKELNSTSSLKRIRFITSHPKDLAEGIIKVVKESDKVCEHFHLPIQAGSDKILKLMNRGYTKDYYLDLAKKIRKEVPGASITTDIMVGFPGETEDDFKDTLDVAKKTYFDHAYMFIYSPRPGTKAAEMKGQVSKEVKSKRFKRFFELQKENSFKRNSSYVGKTQEVLVEEKSKKDKSKLTGRTKTNKIVNFSGPPDLINQLVQVNIKKAHSWYLEGELVHVS